VQCAELRLRQLPGVPVHFAIVTAAMAQEKPAAPATVVMKF
jgi:hypothetical protein